MNNAQAKRLDKAELREEEEQAQSRARVGYILPSRITGTLRYWPPIIVESSFLCCGNIRRNQRADKMLLLTAAANCENMSNVRR